jgi:undecaprenyl-diphosphatase
VDLVTHYLQIILLGIVEGVTEFLPISSTGHLLIAEALGLGHEPDVFNVVIQAGAILAVVFIYWSKIVALLTNLENRAARDYLLKIGTVISLVLIKHFHLHLPETLGPVAWATLIGGFVIFGVEFLSKNLYSHDDVSWLEAVLMGAAQVIAAAFPGASRSGSTIMTGLALGMKRPAATEFSFLLGIPTMFAASALDLWRYRKQLSTPGDHQLIIDIVLGFFISMVVAFFVVKWLLRFIMSHTFNGFGVYRVILGTVLLVALSTHLLKDADAEERAAPGSPAQVTSPAQAQPVPTLAPAATPTTNMDTTSSAPPLPPPTNSGPVPPVPEMVAPAVTPAPVTPTANPPATTNNAPPDVRTP